MLQKFAKEFIQEVLRVYALASPVIIAYLITVFEVMRDTGEFSIDWRFVIAISVLAILKGTDRGLFESGIYKKGLTRF